MEKFTENVKEIIKLIKKTAPYEFYTALTIYDMTGEENPSVDVCESVYEYLQETETIYNESVRNDIQDIVDCNRKTEEEQK